jgi:hypothetical protein
VQAALSGCLQILPRPTYPGACLLPLSRGSSFLKPCAAIVFAASAVIVFEACAGELGPCVRINMEPSCNYSIKTRIIHCIATREHTLPFESQSYTTYAGLRVFAFLFHFGKRARATARRHAARNLWAQQRNNCPAYITSPAVANGPEYKIKRQFCL